MLTKKAKNIIAILIIFCSISCIIYKYYNEKNINEFEKTSVEVFIKETVKRKEVDKEKKTKSKANEVINYIAVLEIPKINLKRGLVDPNSPRNNVGDNIQIIKPVSMPDEEDSTFILASHSGSSRVAFFNRLNELSKHDDVFVYYKGYKYRYRIKENYNTKKTGSILVNKSDNESVIILTSCSPSNTMQLVYIGILEGKEIIK